jgi:hypothetical protein
MKSILWVSQFPPLPVQEEGLKGVYGDDCTISHQNIRNAQEVARVFRGNFSDLVVVAPMAALDHICRQGIKPLWAEMSQTGEGKPDLQFRGNRFWFQGFRRLGGITLGLEDIIFDQSVKRVLRVTRHSPTGAELRAINNVFPNAQIFEAPQPFRSGREIVERKDKIGAEEILVVAPYSVYDQLLKAGIQPLYAQINNQSFESLQRIVAVDMQFIDV